MKAKYYVETWVWMTLLMYFLYDVVWLLAEPEEFHDLIESGPAIIWIDLGYCALFTTYDIYFGNLLLNSRLLRHIKKGKPLAFGGIFLISNTLLAIIIEHVLNDYMLPISNNDTWGNAYLMGLISSMQALAVATDYYYRQSKRKEEEKRQLELQVLKLQLNPHFLFNSLSALTGLVHDDGPRAERYVVRLSRIYRHFLDHMDDETVTLDEAFRITDDYMALLQLRYQHVVLQREPFTYAPDECILRQSLQLLIENAVKHNASSSRRPLTITIGRDGDRLSVSNNVIRPDHHLPSILPTSHMGLTNLAKRYLLNLNREIKIEQTQTRYTVWLPITKKQHTR